MNGSFSGNAFDNPISGLNPNTAAGDNNPVMTADRVEIKKTFFVYVGNNQPELVDMSGEHQHRISVGIQGRKTVSERIFLIFVGRIFDILVKNSLRFGFIT